jgi:hypothetical protein
MPGEHQRDGGEQEQQAAHGGRSCGYRVSVISARTVPGSTRAVSVASRTVSRACGKFLEEAPARRHHVGEDSRHGRPAR